MKKIVKYSLWACGVIIGLPIVAILIFVGYILHSDSETDNNENLRPPLTWNRQNFVDEFGAPTSNHYEQTSIIGRFSNSATTDSKLKVIINIQCDSTISFRFREYGTSVVKNTKLSGKARDSNGFISEFVLYVDDDGWSDMVPDWPWNKKTIKMLSSNHKVDIVLNEASDLGIPSKYYFTIPENSGLKEAMDRANK